MIQKVGAQGVKLKVSMWDDGSDNDDVTKIYVRSNRQGIQSIYFDYVKSGKLKEGLFHGFLEYGFTQTFEINHQTNEHLESVECYYNTKTECIQAIKFKTNFRTSELMGYINDGIKFTLAVEGKKIIGFHGSGGLALFSLGAYFTSVTPTRLEAKGGLGGKKWDDGSDYDNISKIEVLGVAEGIQYIKIDYVKNGKVTSGSIHGVSGDGFTQTFEIKHLIKEYLVYVECFYDDASGVIQGLRLKTNINRSIMMGFSKGRKFSLASNGNQIIGFHGYAEKNLNSLGAYFSTTTTNKLECQGQLSGLPWDDGSNYDGVRKVCVDSAVSVISIRFEYDNGGKVVKTPYGRSLSKEEEFVLDYPKEYITSVEGTLVVPSTSTITWISSLIFKTSEGRTSPTFGEVSARKFVLEKKGSALVGFHGWKSHGSLYALGAYYRPLPPPPDATKLVAKGVDRGDSWDDGGTFNGVRKIFVGVNENGVAFVKFMYFKSARMVYGDDHGNKTLLFDVHEFELDLIGEHITLVEGSYDVKSGVITMLRFKTNKKASTDFGRATSSTFVLHKGDHKIVGFYGKSSNMLHQIGVHVLPIGFKFTF